MYDESKPFVTRTDPTYDYVVYHFSVKSPSKYAFDKFRKMVCGDLRDTYHISWVMRSTNYMALQSDNLKLYPTIKDVNEFIALAKKNRLELELERVDNATTGAKVCVKCREDISQLYVIQSHSCDKGEN